MLRRISLTSLVNEAVNNPVEGLALEVIWFALTLLARRHNALLTCSAIPVTTADSARAKLGLYSDLRPACIQRAAPRTGLHEAAGAHTGRDCTCTQLPEVLSCKEGATTPDCQ
jgi:hypothetical protein